MSGTFSAGVILHSFVDTRQSLPNSAFDEMFTKEAPVDSVTEDVANSTASSGVFKYTFSKFAFDITADTGSI